MKIIETHIHYLRRLSPACFKICIISPSIFTSTFCQAQQKPKPQFNWADLEVSSAAQNLTILLDVTTLACYPISTKPGSSAVK